MGGSQGAKTINTAALEILETLSKRIKFTNNLPNR